MNDLESGESKNYEQLNKKDDSELKEELHLGDVNNQPILDSPPHSSPLLAHQNIIFSSKKRSSQQFKALVYKNFQLQSRQIGTNIFQVL